MNTLYSIKNKLSKYNDEVVVAFDSRNYWRRDLFPLYKKHREKEHEKSDFDWDVFFECMNQLKIEFKENLPFKILEIDKAEADDIIAVLCQEYGMKRDICISSSDKDFLQLQTDDNLVVQYSPWHKGFRDRKKVEYDLFTHIVKGDKDDNVPNILSDDDVYLDETKRSKPIQVKKLDVWREYATVPEYFCESIEILQKYERNKQLVDLSMIPEDIRASVLEAYHNTQPIKGKFFHYCAKHRLVKIMERYL